jgi:hypothetical protein
MAIGSCCYVSDSAIASAKSIESDPNARSSMPAPQHPGSGRLTVAQLWRVLFISEKFSGFVAERGRTFFGHIRGWSFEPPNPYDGKPCRST